MHGSKTTRSLPAPLCHPSTTTPTLVAIIPRDFGSGLPTRPQRSSVRDRARHTIFAVDQALEGWCTDPYGRHEARWMSQGTPTELVRDGGAESFDGVATDEPFTVRPVPVKAAPHVPGGFERADDPRSWEPPLPVRARRARGNIASHSPLPPEIERALFSRFLRLQKWRNRILFVGLAALIATGIGWAFDTPWLYVPGFALLSVSTIVRFCLDAALRRYAGPSD
jgi:hypothetical protein